MSIPENTEKPSSKTLATIVATLLILLAFALGAFASTFVAGCGGAIPHAEQAQLVAFAHVVDSGGDALAYWSLSNAPCEGLSPVACVDVARGKDRALWDAWDAFALAWDAYAAGGEPGPVLDAYCALVRVVPAEAPRVLVVAGMCP